MEDKKLNSGLPGLDKKLDYFRYGENIVYRVKHIDKGIKIFRLFFVAVWADVIQHIDHIFFRIFHRTYIQTAGVVFKKVYCLLQL